MALSASNLFEGTTVLVLALHVPWTSSLAAPVGAWTDTIVAVVVENASAITERDNGHTVVVWSVESLSIFDTVELVSSLSSLLSSRVWSLLN